MDKKEQEQPKPVSKEECIDALEVIRKVGGGNVVVSILITAKDEYQILESDQSWSYMQKKRYLLSNPEENPDDQSHIG